MEEILNWFAMYWEIVIATVVLIMASLDKVALIALKSFSNIRAEWRKVFPKGE